MRAVHAQNDGAETSSYACGDQVPAAALLAAGAFHTCSATGQGRTALAGSDGGRAEARNITCWGWGESGQLTPPAEIDHVMAVASGAKHSCALNRY